MAKNKRIQKAERESMNIKDKLLEALKVFTPEVFAEGKVNWDKVRLVLGEHLDVSSEKFNFTWAGKTGAVTNVVIPSKATLRPAEKESVKFDKGENIFIEGDNLEVLKLLQKSYFEQIKMIYIDPPYNTGNDFVYKDDFRQPLKNYLEQSGQVDSEGNRLSTNTQASGRFHSDWLTMMYPRLKLAWNLLRHDGVIFVSIADNEIHHLRMMMDEIFGEENLAAQLVWRKKAGGGSDSKYFAIEHEYVLCYLKSKDLLKSFDIPYSEEEQKRFSLKDKKARYYLKTLERPERLGPRPNLQYPIICPDGSKIEFKANKKKYTWVVSQETFKKMKAENEIVFNKVRDSSWRVYRKVYMETQTPRGLFYDLALNREGTQEMDEIFGNTEIFSNPKPTALISYLINIVTNIDKDSLILDFFAGSGTTAHAVLEHNREDGGDRKFIMVQMPEPTDPKSEAYKAGFKTIADIAKERIRRVIKGYGDHKSIDDGFKVFKLAESNYFDNLFEYDPDKSVEENDKAFKDYLNKTQKEFFPAKINELGIVYETIIKEGLSLNAMIKEVKIGKSTAYKVSDTERELYISLDEKLSVSAIEALTDKEYKEKIFICFDGALGDSDKANLALNVRLKTI